MRYAPEWSPDGKRLAFSDKDGKLYVLDGRRQEARAGRRRRARADPRLRLVARRRPCSPSRMTRPERHAARSTSGASADGKVHRVTDEFFERESPVVGPRGQVPLLPLRPRVRAADLQRSSGTTRGNRTTGIFALALRKDVPAPVPAGERRGDGRTKTKDADQTRARPPARPTDPPATSGRRAGEGRRRQKRAEADEEGRGPVTHRLRRARRPRRRACRSRPTTTSGLAAAKGDLLYVERRRAVLRPRRRRRKPSLRSSTSRSARRPTLAEDVARLRALARTAPRCSCARATPTTSTTPSRRAKDAEDVSDRAASWSTACPPQEWAQIFDEVWRRYRDFFYVDEHARLRLEGAAATATAPLLRYVAHRSDLNYVLGEMVAELNVGHAYIEGGDFEIPDAARRSPCPGARFALDAASGRYRIAADLPRRERGGALPLAAHRDRRRRPRRRLRAGDRRRGADGAPTTPTGCCATRPTAGHAHR